MDSLLRIRQTSWEPCLESEPQEIGSESCEGEEGIFVMGKIKSSLESFQSLAPAGTYTGQLSKLIKTKQLSFKVLEL